MLYKIKVENIKCGGCANAIKSGLGKIPGVENVSVDIENGIIRVESTADIGQESMVEKLRLTGYPEPGSGSGFVRASSYISCMLGRITSQ